MTVTADKAADVARRFGLSLTDARALSVLADDEDHAERLAAKFGAEGGNGGKAGKASSAIEAGREVARRRRPRGGVSDTYSDPRHRR